MKRNEGRSNLVLRLDDGDDGRGSTLIARVAMATSLVRVGMTWLRREVEIARFLDGAGVAVTRPATAIDAGPHERDGFVISFWELETIVNASPNCEDAGRALRAAHVALRDYPRDQLPLWGGFEEARLVMARAKESGVMTSAEHGRLARAWERAESIVEAAAARTASMQAVHGDAHLGNVLATTRGAVWSDWEDAFIGPIEFDLACLRSRLELFGEEKESIEAMTHAYGDCDRDLVRDLGLVRNVQVIPWLAVFAERQPELVPRMRRRLERLV